MIASRGCFRAPAEAWHKACPARDGEVHGILPRRRLQGQGDATFAAYLEGMPKSYFIGHKGAAIAAHAKVIARRGDKPVVVDVVPSRHHDAIELCVAAQDRPGLLASFAAALAANRLGVMTAHIFNRPLEGGRNEAVDFFAVRRANRDGAEATEN